MIPRTIHHVWLGDPMPDHLAAYVATWAEHHPTWEHRRLSHPPRRMRVAGRCANSPGRGQPLARGVDMPKATCGVEQCDRSAVSLGPCKAHSLRFYRHGDVNAGMPIRIVGDDAARWWSKVARRADDECWMWLGVTGKDGYGRFDCGGRGKAPALAHRWGYEQFVAPVAVGLTLDHLCRTRGCVNFLRHLEPVTVAENSRRGDRAKLTAADAAEIRRLRSLGVRRTLVADQYGISVRHVTSIVNGTRW